MLFRDYAIMAMRTARAQDDNLMNAALGLVGEVGEVVDHIKKHKFQEHDLDREKIILELGDVLWYLNLAAETLGSSLDDVAEKNILKLDKRYGGIFSAAKSINREDE